MTTPSCTKCGDTRWVRYFSETMDEDLEEAFRLCACDYGPGGQGEPAREKPEIVEIALTDRF